MKVFNAIKTIEELLAYIDVKESNRVLPSITLDYNTIIEMRVRLNMLFAYISALREEKK